eukprot:g8912.t1
MGLARACLVFLFTPLVACGTETSSRFLRVVSRSDMQAINSQVANDPSVVIPKWHFISLSLICVCILIVLTANSCCCCCRRSTQVYEPERRLASAFGWTEASSHGIDYGSMRFGFQYPSGVFVTRTPTK